MPGFDSTVDACVAIRDAKQIDGHTLEISAPQGTIINDIIARLTTLGIEIRSMRNKSNRLEEIFLRLTDTHPKHL
jgi:ABC-2 type transport system ATP-binding protein